MIHLIKSVVTKRILFCGSLKYFDLERSSYIHEEHGKPQVM